MLVDASDDVQVEVVELIVDGVTHQVSDTTSPFAFALPLPARLLWLARMCRSAWAA